MDYLDFELEVRPLGGRQYELVVIKSPAGEARERVTFPLDTLQLNDSLKDVEIALLRSSKVRRKALTEEEQSVQNFGRHLFDFLLPSELRGLYRTSLNRARREDKGLRLKLRLADPALANLPWEFLYDAVQREYLCLAPETPLVRYVELERTLEPLAVVAPLRVLGVVSSPTNLPDQLDIGREKQRVEEALADLQAEGLVELHWLAGQTWRDLQKALRGGPWHILHFIGHGGFDTHKDEGFLLLADEKGEATRLYAAELGRLLAGHRPLRLALLNACEGAKGGRDLFSSTARILMERGLPAVLAMQYEISDTAAIEFARTFYETLAEGFPVDRATAEARIAVSLAFSHTVEWGIPVLAMRAPDGHLFGQVQARRDDFSRSVPPAVVLEEVKTAKAATTNEETTKVVTTSRETAKAVTTNVLGIEWVEIPAGEFWMGDNNGLDNEKPCHLVELPTYWIAKTPITNAQYQKFVQATGHSVPKHWENGKVPQGKENHPVVYVSWDDGMALAKWASEQTGQTILLPSEAEWEKAARGGLVLPNGQQNPLPKRKYPWGEASDKSKCNTDESGIKTTTPVDKYPQGASPYGVLDLSGNVWEWTRSLYKPYPYVARDGLEDLQLRDSRVWRGGAWNLQQFNARAASRGDGHPNSRGSPLGLRLVRAPRPPSLPRPLASGSISER